MIRDEFNNVEVTNDKQLLKVEYGKTQKFEFSSQKDNETPEGELNEKYIGKTIKKVTEVNVDYVNKVQTHATQTVTTTATTATSAASAVAATAVAASTVAVVAIATVTGISVALHDYHCELTSLLITSDSITYQMSIVDNKRDDGADYQSYDKGPEPRGRFNDVAGNPDEEKDYYDDDPNSIFDDTRPFVLRISSNSYVSEHYLDYGLSNYGSFSGLTLGDKYNITLSENRYGGEILYNETFTTYKNSFMTDFYMSGEANYKLSTFGVYLDYIDELDCLSDFTVTLTEKENSENKYIVPLEKVKGFQDVEVRGNNQDSHGFDFEKAYTYAFSYKKNDELIEYQTGDVTFYNTSPYISEVHGVTWDKKANFLNNLTTITLDFIDDYNIFSNFRFTLVGEEQTADGGDPLVYDLVKTTEPQTVELTSNRSFSYARTYNYMFTYDEEGQDVEQIIDSGSGLRFEDNSGTAVNGVSWDKTINLLTKQFSVTLDYVDDEDYERFSNFQLTLKDQEMPEEMYDDPYDLDKTTQSQVVTIKEDSNLRLRRPMSYSFTYFDRLDNSVHTIEEGVVTFTDSSNGQKEFKGITINPTPDMTNKTIEVQLDYADDFDELYGFSLNLYLEEETPIQISLVTTTEKQTVEVGNYNLDFTKEYHYFVTYYDDATWEEVSPDAGKGTITFDHSVFNQIIFDKKANFDTKAFDIQLDFVDGLNIFSDFQLTIEDDSGQSEVFTLEKTTEVQTLFLNQTETFDDDGETIEIYKFNMNTGRFSCYLSYNDSFLNQHQTLGVEQDFYFTNTLESTFTDVVSPFDFTIENSSGSSYLLPLRFEYNDAAQIYTDFSVEICQNNQDVATLRFEGSTDTKNWQYGVLVPDGLDINSLINASNTSIKVVASLDASGNSYLGEEYDRVVFEKDVTFTLNQHKEIFGGKIVTDMINWGGDIGFQLVYSGQPDDYVDCELDLLAESGVTYRFAIEQLSPGNNYCCIYMDSNNLGNTISEEDFLNDFINYPMKIFITYYKKSTVGNAAGGSDGKDGPYTVTLHEQFKFEQSV